ncbi:MAG TPA: FTR1 family protein [Ktedonobacteraceae bacterium]|jgi:high-affinity iron transporter|nr:FTR1 family protein [Ktedonobacteraceae bacterium]
MIATFVLFLREGLEASLIVSILFAALRQLDQMEMARAVWIGVILAIAASLLGGTALYVTVHDYVGTTFQTIFETITYLVAVILLTSMTFWMQKHSRSLKREITAKASASGSAFALGLLAFSTVGREGLETAVFTLAFAFRTNALLLLIGAFLGLLASIGLCVMIYRLGYRLDFRIFFRIMGILLLFFAAGLLGDAVQNMQQLGWITFGSTPLWNTAHILSEDSTLGDMLHTFLGYAEAPTVLQGLIYALYLLIAGGIFAWITRKPTTGKPAVSSAPTLTANEQVQRSS